MPSTQFLNRPDGDIAYDDNIGQGRTVICVPGMGDLRQSYRFVVPLLQEAGYRVITLDVRGHGESSTTFTDYRASAVGSDIVALLDKLDIHDAVILGNSMAAGSSVWAAAERPDRVGALILTGPFVRDVPINFVLKTILNVILWRPWGPTVWRSFYKSLFKANPPADLETFAATLTDNLRQTGRLEALQSMMKASKADCEAKIPQVRAKTLVLMGTQDPDHSNPAQEAQHVAEALNGTFQMVEGAGHYPHVEQPQLVIQALRDLA